MSNRLNAEFKFPVLPDFAVFGGASGMITDTRVQTEQTIALGQAFAGLFRGTWNFFARLDRSIATARAMHDLANLSDKALTAIGIARSDIPAIIARDEFDQGIEIAIGRYLDAISTTENRDDRLAA